jgi:rhodanese-related sulfurtransferase
MTHTFRHAFVALPMGLLLAGCSGANRSAFRPPSAAAPSARLDGQGAGGGGDQGAFGTDARSTSGGDAGPATRHDAQLANMAMAPEPRHDITLDEIREHVRSGDAVIIDARGPADFALGHVRGALNMPAGHREAYLAQIHQAAAPDQFIIIYCNGPHCDSGDRVYEYLASQGYNNMRVFKPGWETLTSARDLR